MLRNECQEVVANIVVQSKKKKEDRIKNKYKIVYTSLQYKRKRKECCLT